MESSYRAGSRWRVGCEGAATFDMAHLRKPEFEVIQMVEKCVPSVCRVAWSVLVRIFHDVDLQIHSVNLLLLRTELVTTG
jgi:hypothetical protein